MDAGSIMVAAAVVAAVGALAWWLRSGFGRLRRQAEEMRAALEPMEERLRKEMRESARAPSGDGVGRAAAERLQAVARELGAAAEALASRQAELKAVSESLQKELAGASESLKAAAASAGLEALPEKTEAVLRRFEERSAELLEENALQTREALLEALERVRPEPHAG